MVDNLPSNAGDTGLILGQGMKIPYAVGPEGQNQREAPTPQRKILHATTKTDAANNNNKRNLRRWA